MDLRLSEQMAQPERSTFRILAMRRLAAVLRTYNALAKHKKNKNKTYPFRLRMAHGSKWVTLAIKENIS